MKEKKVKWEKPELKSLSNRKQAYGVCTADGVFDTDGCISAGQAANGSCSTTGNGFI